MKNTYTVTLSDNEADKLSRLLYISTVLGEERLNEYLCGQDYLLSVLKQNKLNHNITSFNSKEARFVLNCLKKIKQNINTLQDKVKQSISLSLMVKEWFFIFSCLRNMRGAEENRDKYEGLLLTLGRLKDEQEEKLGFIANYESQILELRLNDSKDLELLETMFIKLLAYSDEIGSKLNNSTLITLRKEYDS